MSSIAITNYNATALAKLVGEVSTLQSLPLIPSDYALTISSAGSVVAADVQISSRPVTQNAGTNGQAAAATASTPNAHTNAASAHFDTAVAQVAAASRLELAA